MLFGLISFKNTKIAKLIDSLIRTIFRILPYSEITKFISLKWGFAFQGDSRVVRTRRGLKIEVAPTDYLQNLIYYTGTFEDHCLSVLCKLLRPGDYLLDIGANIGLFSLESARIVKENGMVYAFEPNSENYNHLLNNIKLNNFTNINAMHFGIGKSHSEISLRLPKGGNKGEYTIGDVEGDIIENICIEKMDDVVTNEDIKKVNFIKMDIEGAEIDALIGMKETIKKHRPIFIVEIWRDALRRFNYTPFDLVNFFQDLNYLGREISKKGLFELTDPEDIVEVDALFIPKEKEHDLLPKINTKHL